jgi:AraC-like DNA-binding protein
MMFKTKLFRRWLLIQVCFLIIMITSTIIIYLYTSNELSKQFSLLYEERMDKIMDEIDTAVVDSFLEGKNYAMLPVMNLISNMKKDSGTSSEREFARLVDTIKQTNSTNSYVSEIIIALPEQDKYISSAGVMDKDIFTQIYTNDSYKGTDVIELLEKEKWDLITPIFCFRDLVEGSRKVAITVPISIEKSKVIVLMDSQYISSLLANIMQFKEGIIAVYSKSGEELFASSDLRQTPHIPFNLNASFLIKDREEIVIDSVSYNYIGAVSEKTSFSYLYFIPSHLFYNQYFNMQRSALIILIVTFIIGIAISYYITLVKFRPIYDISKNSVVLYKKESDLDELKNIEYAIEEAGRTQAVLGSHKRYITDSSWRMLLEEQLAYKDATSYIKGLLNISQSVKYSVSIFDLLLDEKENKDCETLHNEILKYLNHKKIAYSLMYGRSFIVIFEESSNDIIELLKEIRYVFEDSCIVSVGEEGFGYEGLIRSYKTAKKNLNYKILPNQECIITINSEVVNNSISIPNEKEIKFSAFIQSGNYDEAIDLLDELINITEKDRVEPFAYKVYLYNIANSIINTAQYLDNEGKLITQILSRFKYAFVRNTYDNIFNTMKEILYEVCKEYKERHKSSNTTLNSNIIKYIDKNLFNIQLSIDYVADNFCMNSSYLRSFFKEQNGISFGDYLSIERVKRAQEKLLHTSQSVLDISESCGFVSLSTFSRAFRKFSGMTPGQYKKIARIKE